MPVKTELGKKMTPEGCAVNDTFLQDPMEYN